MSFYYIVDVLSRIGDNIDDIHQGVFADNISSFSKGVCENLEMSFKSIGKKHIFCVTSLKGNFEKVNNFLKNMLNSKNRDKVRVKFQYDIKEMMDTVFSGPETDCASLIYTEGKNVFASGYGEVFTYKFSKKLKTCEKIDFPIVADVQTAEEGKNSFSRYVGALESGDEYLVLGKYIPSLLGDEKVKEIFLSNRSDVCRRFSEEILLRDISSGYSLIHIKVKKSLKPVFISIGLAAILCAVLGLLIFV